MIVEFTDREYAMIINGLQSVRDQLANEGSPYVETQAVLTKLYDWCTPNGCGFTAVTGEDAKAVHRQHFT